LNCAKFVAAICFILIQWAPMAFCEDLKTEPVVVKLIGHFVKPEFKDEITGKQGRYFAIQLDSPVDVEGDDFGEPVKGIKLMQLVFFGP
jgi:hypothetical protein